MNRFMQTASILFAWTLLLCGSLAFSQETIDRPKLNIIDQLGIPGLGGSSGGEKANFSAEYRIAEGTREGRVSVTATMQPDWHVYSVTQPPGATQRSVIKLASNDRATITGEFKPDVSPDVKEYEFFDVPVEEHAGKVVWTAPIQLAEGVDPKTTELQLKFNGQVCQEEGSCIPISNKSIVARFAGYYKEDSAAAEFRTESNHLTIRGTIQPANARPGDVVTLTLSAEPAPTWHVYAYAERDPKEVSKPTLIAITEPSDWQTSAVTASATPIEHQTGTEEQPLAYFYDEPVSWAIEITIPEDAAPGDHAIAGMIGVQTCTLTDCDKPTAAAFHGTITIGTEAPGESPLRFTPAKYSEVSRLTQQPTDGDTDRETSRATSQGFDRTRITIADETKQQPLWAAIGIALAGGFILNFMPCVLPVIGLKIMSFVQQAGESRSRAFALNLWYSAGLLVVFMVLATLAAVWSVGWGQQNQSSLFNIIMASVVFTMGLSFLGVWEIPIPGFVGTGKATELAAQEGASGAFAKGIITTILAVPCSGPLVATALTWCADKPPALVYMTFACMGLGMASPYLLIGAFPGLMRFMPKPGAWMDTFKQAMGFVLLGTVVWIMSYLPWPLLLPMVAFLFGLWAACWWVGRTSLTADFQTKARAWTLASGFAVLIGMFSFMWFDEVMAQRFTAAIEREIAQLQFERTTSTSDLSANNPRTAKTAHHLPWQAFSLSRLQDLTAQGQTVMVDFTADWCPTCKVLEVKSLNTAPVKSVIEKNGIVPLLADWTDADEEISEMLELLGSKQIPVLAIFPAGRPNEPIVLRGWYSTDTLVQKLQEAGASKIAMSNTRAAADAVARE